MSAIPALFQPVGGKPLSSRSLLAVAFLAFTYALLSWRALLLKDVAEIFSERRLLTVIVGAGIFWLVLRETESSSRMSLARATSWIVAGTALVLSAKLIIHTFSPSDPLLVNDHVLLSLVWGGYFGLWIMGAIAFRDSRASAIDASEARSNLQRAPDPAATDVSADDLVGLVDDLVRLVDVLRPELATLSHLEERHHARIPLATHIAADLHAREIQGSERSGEASVLPFTARPGARDIENEPAPTKEKIGQGLKALAPFHHALRRLKAILLS